MRANLMFDKKVVDSIRALSLDMIDTAKSGHPGISLGAATIMYTLYSKHINYNTSKPNWINRDRFVMSCGHGSALLYSTLFFNGYNISLDNLKEYRKLNSKIKGHPEHDLDIGVEMTTGPLGQGLATAVGMAMAERYLAATFNRNTRLIDHNTFVLCSDGDLMEGISYEAASIAGNLKLGKLIVLYDSNNFSLDGNTSLTFSEDVLRRFESMGWHTQIILDGDNIDEIDRAIVRAKSIIDKPSLIEIKTIIGKGSFKQNTQFVHGTPLTDEDIIQFKEKNNIRRVPFSISSEQYEYAKAIFKERCSLNYSKWESELSKFRDSTSNEMKEKFEKFVKNEYIVDFNNILPETNNDSVLQMREINKKILNTIADFIPNLIGGSADLASSTKTYLDKYNVFSSRDYSGRNICFGVREHAMGAILNGLALSDLRPFGSTFLVFSDYIKPAIRLSAMLDIPVTYIFTHDNISIGSDGKTHQPVEQLAMLRSIPNFNVYRPADQKEIVGSWNCIINSKKPSALILSRSESKLIDTTDSMMVGKGAYIVRKEQRRLNGIIIATGTEVKTAIDIANILSDKGIDIRVISMPSIELFNQQDQDYKGMLLPVGYKTIVIEYSSSLSWYSFVYNKRYLITLDEFGESGSTDEILKHFNFDIESLVKKVEDLLK